MILIKRANLLRFRALSKKLIIYFFKEVYNPNNVRILSPWLQQVLKVCHSNAGLWEGGNLCFLKPSQTACLL